MEVLFFCKKLNLWGMENKKSVALGAKEMPFTNNITTKSGVFLFMMI